MRDQRLALSEVGVARRILSVTHKLLAGLDVAECFSVLAMGVGMAAAVGVAPTVEASLASAIGLALRADGAAATLPDPADLPDGPTAASRGTGLPSSTPSR